MNWFFEPLGDFFLWSFKGLTWLGEHYFNVVLIVIGAAMTIWWMAQMARHPKEH
ncbi:MAG: hypothetical protein IBJ09_05045 [Bacteroidia bacterium]|nr:hypothetical protein [Bacteroidia bacterium]